MPFSSGVSASTCCQPLTRWINANRSGVGGGGGGAECGAGQRCPPSKPRRNWHHPLVPGRPTPSLPGPPGSSSSTASARASASSWPRRERTPGSICLGRWGEAGGGLAGGGDAAEDGASSVLGGWAGVLGVARQVRGRSAHAAPRSQNRLAPPRCTTALSPRQPTHHLALFLGPLVFGDEAAPELGVVLVCG